MEFESSDMGFLHQWFGAQRMRDARNATGGSATFQPARAGIGSLGDLCFRKAFQQDAETGTLEVCAPLSHK
jgi:hypothetical protein